MPSYKEVHKDRWLTADHLQGKIVPITIAFCGLEEYYDKQTRQNETQLAAHFPGKEIMLSLNRTRCEALAKIAGTDDYDKWRNVRVRLQAGVAPNRKPTIVILPPLPIEGAAPVHGPQTSEPVHGPVHGPTNGASAPVHGKAEPEASGAWQEEIDFSRPPDDEEESEPLVHGLEGGESDLSDPKSAGDGTEAGAPDGDELFFTAEDFVTAARTYHNESTEPTNAKRHNYLIEMLAGFSGGNGPRLMDALFGRAVSEANPIGAEAARFLYNVMRADTPFPKEQAALRTFCERELVKM